MKWVWMILVLLVGSAAVVVAVVMRGGEGDSTVVAGAKIGMISHRAITESSGLVASRKHAGIFWTHNDQGNAAVIFAITREGKCVGEFPILDKPDDWEAIATDDAGNLYVADIGNNDGKRKTVHVYRLAEPDPTKPAAGKLAVDRTFKLTFPGKPFDAESLFVHGGFGYVISKVGRKEPAGIYRFPLEAPGDERRKSVGAVLERVASLPTDSPVTDADLSPDASRLAVVSEKGLYVFAVNGDLSKAGDAPFELWPLDREHDIEGCAFTDGGILATSETREIYFFPDDRFPPTSGK